jgi:hypothetical protein
MLTGSLAATEIVLQVFGTITTNMECRLHHEVFENMVASFADVARYRSPLTAAGLFDFGYDASIRRQLIRRPLSQRIADLSGNTCTPERCRCL